jgi:SAM-dependent methyltransferase
MKLLAQFVLAAAFVAAAPAFAQADKKFEPQVGQAGKDVIWVPTPEEVVDRMLTMAQVGPNDFVVDLGSGDGRTVIAAAKRGAKALGIEYNPDMVKLSEENARKAGVTERASFRRADIFQTDFSQATVVTLYLLPALNMKLRPQILQMKPGTRVVSHSFTMEDWEPDEVSTMDGRRAYFWVVPATVMGSWTLETGGQKSELTLEQTFQKIDGWVALGAVHGGLRDARLRGADIAFSYIDDKAVRRDFTGKVDGRQMSGSFRDQNGATGSWSATRN